MDQTPSSYEPPLPQKCQAWDKTPEWGQGKEMRKENHYSEEHFLKVAADKKITHLNFDIQLLLP